MASQRRVSTAGCHGALLFRAAALLVGSDVRPSGYRVGGRGGHSRLRSVNEQNPGITGRCILCLGLTPPMKPIRSRIPNASRGLPAHFPVAPRGLARRRRHSRHSRHSRTLNECAQAVKTRSSLPHAAWTREVLYACFLLGTLSLNLPRPLAHRAGTHY